MQWYVYIVTTSAAAILGWIALRSLGLPIRTLLELRHNVLEQMLVLESVSPPKPRELAVSSREIDEYNYAVRKVREAQHTFRNLGSQLLAFVENEPFASNALVAVGLNAAESGNRLIALSMSYSQPHIDRAALRLQIRKALRSIDAATATSRNFGGEFLAMSDSASGYFDYVNHRG